MNILLRILYRIFFGKKTRQTTEKAIRSLTVVGLVSAAAVCICLALDQPFQGVFFPLLIGYGAMILGDSGIKSRMATVVNAPSSKPHVTKKRKK